MAKIYRLARCDGLVQLPCALSLLVDRTHIIGVRVESDGGKRMGAEPF